MKHAIKSAFKAFAILLMITFIITAINFHLQGGAVAAQKFMVWLFLSVLAFIIIFSYKIIFNKRDKISNNLSEKSSRSLHISQSYLAAAMITGKPKINSKEDILITQIFIAGVVDAQRQIDEFSWKDFYYIYGFLLKENGIHPKTDIESFIEKILYCNQKKPLIGEIMKSGAYSIRDWIKGKHEVGFNLGLTLTGTEKDKIKNIITDYDF